MKDQKATKTNTYLIYILITINLLLSIILYINTKAEIKIAKSQLLKQVNSQQKIKIIKINKIKENNLIISCIQNTLYANMLLLTASPKSKIQKLLEEIKLHLAQSNNVKYNDIILAINNIQKQIELNYKNYNLKIFAIADKIELHVNNWLQLHPALPNLPQAKNIDLTSKYDLPYKWFKLISQEVNKQITIKQYDNIKIDSEDLNLQIINQINLYCQMLKWATLSNNQKNFNYAVKNIAKLLNQNIFVQMPDVNSLKTKLNSISNIKFTNTEISLQNIIFSLNDLLR